MIWIQVRPLYGEPDAGRIWYNTFTHWLLVDESFVRSDGDPCHFYRQFKDGSDIQLDLYVDDGNTFDTNVTECDAFYERMAKAFLITLDDGQYFLGMDVHCISPTEIKLTNDTYILSMIARELPQGIDKYRSFHTPSDPCILEYYSIFSIRRKPES